MGGKTSKSTQQITIPPEVLARYNAINARADTVTNKPYQYYTGQFVAPLTATQQSGIANTNAAAGMAQPYFGAATNQLMGAQQAATPYYQTATDQLNQGVNAGAQYAGQSSNTINAAQSEGAGIQQGALSNLGAAYASAQPYNEAAGGLYQQGLAQGSDITGQSLAGTQQALTGAQPYQGMATDYMTSGAQAVNPYDLGADQINKYMSPYLNTVLQGTAGLLNQQNQQQQAGQMGNAIRSGAFGGDRGGIAAANLNQQQNLANAQIFSGLLNQGFGQALGTAQQQQQLGLSAAQANRAAQQQASQQALAIGQQGFGQGLAAAQQQGALGQQLFNMNSTTGQNAAALGQQVYGQGTNTAQQQSNVGNTLFNQGATTAAQQAALGQQQFGQGATAAAQSAALGQGLYGMGAATSQQLAGLGVGAQEAALSGAGAQLAAGQVDQATQQAENTAKYNEFLQAQSLPYQQLKLAGDIALGTGTAQGSTTTTAQPGGFFSDERLKENIKAVGKTFDGQTIHSYNYKGDPRTQIGLIAQEVQKHHPEAVGLAGGYKTVDYDKATEDASDRGHMAYGGLASAGGSVMPQDAGQGFAGGGGVGGFDPAMMQQIIAAQQAMYAPISKGGMYSGGPDAGGGLVPQTELTARQLMTPAELTRQATGAEQANAVANLGKTVGELGGEVGAWDWGGEEAKKQAKTPVPTTGAPAPAATGVAPPEPVDTTPPAPEDFFGRKGHYALGGGVPYGGQGLDIPEEDASSKSYQLSTPGETPGKPESGLDKVGKAAKIAGTVAKVAAMFSDKRMKENIKPIGKLFDGQIVHSYNYKGDPRTQIGLIAQEVEGHKPHAVGLAGKYKTVDYDKATSGAAKRGHFAAGGMPEEEMEDVPSYEPTGLYSGDNKFIRNLFKSTASGNKNIDLMSGEELPAQIGEEAPKDVGFAKIPEPAGLAGAAKAGLPELLKIKKPMEFVKPAGLAPAAASLPKDLSQIGRLIFAAEGDGQAKTSSALGRYGIIKGTYVDYFKKAFPERARQLGDAGIKALRTTPEGRKLNEQFGPMIIADNAKSLSRAGLPTNAGTIYLAHFLGPAGAVRALSVSPDTPIQKAVDKDAIDANYDVFVKKNIRTAGDLLNWSNSTMAKRAKELGHATGGLAGRNGYATDGRVEDEKKEFQLSDQLFQDANDLYETDKLIQGLDVQKVQPGPETFFKEEPVPQQALAAGAPAPMPAAPVAEKPVGLAAADAAAAPAPKDNNIFRGKFVTGLKEGKATSVIPFLSGLAAMGTAPTRSLGVALSAGIGAGAQAAQGQRAFGIKQGELAVAKQLADARTMEITKGILEGRYEFLENGMVRDTYTDTFLPTDLATIAKGKAFKEGPMEAITGKAEGAISRKDYLEKYPTAGTVIPDLPPSFSYEVDPKNPSKTILALAEMTPGVREARKLRDKAEYAMKKKHEVLSAPGIGQNRLAQLTNDYTLSVGDYNRANEQWEKILTNVAATPLKALEAGQAAQINVNAEALGPLIADARTAIATKETIKQIRGEISEGGPLAPLQQNIGLRMQQVGFSPEFVKSLIGQDPASLNVQNSLANQLTLNGIDPATLRDGAGTINARKAVEALLNNVDKRADGQIAAFDAANTAFKYDPLGADTPGKSINAQRGENNAKYLRDHPKPGTYEKGTVYYVGGKRFVVN